MSLCSHCLSWSVPAARADTGQIGDNYCNGMVSQKGMGGGWGGGGVKEGRGGGEERRRGVCQSLSIVARCWLYLCAAPASLPPLTQSFYPSPPLPSFPLPHPHPLPESSSYPSACRWKPRKRQLQRTPGCFTVPLQVTLTGSNAASRVGLRTSRGSGRPASSVSTTR